jgi:hypothetical protein
MIEITFKDFYELNYRETEAYELYVMKNGHDEVLYVGISSQNIWGRWFGWNGHIFDDNLIKAYYEVFEKNSKWKKK